MIERCIQMKEMIGIAGGMGSHATVYLFQQLINKSPAKRDQEYMEILIHNNPFIADRTEGILYQGVDPVPQMLRSIQLLENSGATTILLACITAHYYYNTLKQSLKKAKLFNMIEETVDYSSSIFPGVRNIGILATEGTIKTGIWKKVLDQRQINIIVLPQKDQMEYFNQVVYGSKGIKAGYRNRELKSKLIEGCNILNDMGAEVIIGACSELPLMISKEDLPIPYIDSVHATVQKLIEKYYG